MFRQLFLVLPCLLLAFGAPAAPPAKQLLKLSIGVSEFKDGKINVAASIARLSQRYGGSTELFRQPLTEYEGGNFYFEAMIGTFGARAFKLFLDTTYSNFWVFDANCRNSGRVCSAQNQYDWVHSGFAEKYNDTMYTINYNGNSMPGAVYTDIFCFGQFSSSFSCTDQWQPFVGALSDPGNSGLDYDGVLGLSYDSIHVPMPQPMKQIFALDSCRHPLFALWMDRNQDNVYKRGELHICDTESMRFNGQISYARVNGMSWRIPVDSIVVGLIHIADSINAAVDTGSYFMSGPTDQVAKLQSLIGSTAIGGGEYQVDCNKISQLPDIAVRISGTDFVLKGADYIVQTNQNGQKLCVSGILGVDMPTSYGPWVLGNLFVSRFYTVFDFTNTRVGFANATYTPYN